MESESAIQLVLRRNRMKCLDLNYSKIASFLISNDILSEVQHRKFKNASADSTGRMDDLMSFLYELNSVEAFNIFRDGVILCGEMGLADSLKMSDSASAVSVPVIQVEPKIDCILIPEILAKVFNYLPKNELLNSRRVCQTWNNVAIQFFSSMFTLKLKSGRNNSNNLVDYIQIVSNSLFCQALSSFRLSVQTYSETEKGLWKTFFERFGRNIKSLTLSALNTDVVELIFSIDIQNLVTNLTHFHLNVSLDNAFVAKTTLCFLLQLKHLAIIPTGQRSEYGQIEFLSKFLKLEHKLESLALLGHFCIGELPLDIIPNLFRTNTIESLDVSSQSACFLGDQHFKQMTIKNTLSRLKDIKFDKMGLIKNITFHQFLVCHRHTLKKISISEEFLVNDFPKLDNVTHLAVHAVIDSTGLSFCTQFSKLKVLRLKLTNAVFHCSFTSFEHRALQSLYLNMLFNSNTIVSAIPIIATYFPNLTKLETLHDPREILPLTVGNFHRQIREPGRSVWISSSNGILE